MDDFDDIFPAARSLCRKHSETWWRWTSQDVGDHTPRTGYRLPRLQKGNQGAVGKKWLSTIRASRVWTGWERRIEKAISPWTFLWWMCRTRFMWGKLSPRPSVAKYENIFVRHSRKTSKEEKPRNISYQKDREGEPTRGGFGKSGHTQVWLQDPYYVPCTYTETMFSGRETPLTTPSTHVNYNLQIVFEKLRKRATVQWKKLVSG